MDGGADAEEILVEVACRASGTEEVADVMEEEVAEEQAVATVVATR